MKTITLLTLSCLLSLSSIAQTVVKNNENIKVKPVANNKSGTTTSSKPKKTEKKKEDKRECRMDKRRCNDPRLSMPYYECPKCHYDTCEAGRCPHDKRKLDKEFGPEPNGIKCN